MNESLEIQQNYCKPVVKDQVCSKILCISEDNGRKTKGCFKVKVQKCCCKLELSTLIDVKVKVQLQNLPWWLWGVWCCSDFCLSSCSGKLSDLGLQ